MDFFSSFLCACLSGYRLLLSLLYSKHLSLCHFYFISVFPDFILIFFYFCFYLQELENLLGGRPPAVPIPADVEEVNLTEFEENYNSGSSQGNYYDEDDDHPHLGGQHVQCAHQ